MAGVSYIDAEVEDLAVAPGVIRDVSPSFTPEFQASGLVRYAWPERILGGELALQFHVNHQSSFFHNIRNFQSHELPGYTVGNVRASWTSMDNRWEAAIFANNLWDERYRILGFELSGLCGCSEEAYGKPRWVGGSVRYNFF